MGVATSCKPDACDDDACNEEGALACEDSLVLQCTLVESEDDGDGKNDEKKCQALLWQAVRDCSDEGLQCIDGACACF